MSYLLNSYAGVRFVGRSDSWYEPDDDDYEVLYEKVYDWIVDCAEIPETMISREMVEGIMDEYRSDPEVLNDGYAEVLHDEYLKLRDASDDAEPVPLDILEGL
jgi:hypothetical protein